MEEVREVCPYPCSPDASGQVEGGDPGVDQEDGVGHGAVAGPGEGGPGEAQALPGQIGLQEVWQ